MNVEIKEIGKEDGYYDSIVTYVSLEQSFAEAALRLQLASNLISNMYSHHRQKYVFLLPLQKN
jgi:hypothetical protein